jgi:hypothetical protein
MPSFFIFCTCCVLLYNHQHNKFIIKKPILLTNIHLLCTFATCFAPAGSWMYCYCTVLLTMCVGYCWPTEVPCATHTLIGYPNEVSFNNWPISAFKLIIQMNFRREPLLTKRTHPEWWHQSHKTSISLFLSINLIIGGLNLLSDANLGMSSLDFYVQYWLLYRPSLRAICGLNP